MANLFFIYLPVTSIVLHMYCPWLHRYYQTWAEKIFPFPFMVQFIKNIFLKIQCISPWLQRSTLPDLGWISTDFLSLRICLSGITPIFVIHSQLNALWKLHSLKIKWKYYQLFKVKLFMKLGSEIAIGAFVCPDDCPGVELNLLHTHLKASWLTIGWLWLFNDLVVA